MHKTNLQAPAPASNESQLSFELVPDNTSNELSAEQAHEVIRAIKDFIVWSNEAHAKTQASSMYEVLYSLNVFPESNVTKYFTKSGVKKDTTSSLSSDWQKVGNDLWLSTLSLTENSNSKK